MEVARLVPPEGARAVRGRTATSQRSSGGIACLTLLVYHMLSSTAASNVATSDDPRHDETTHETHEAALDK